MASRLAFLMKRRSKYFVVRRRTWRPRSWWRPSIAGHLQIFGPWASCFLPFSPVSSLIEVLRMRNSTTRSAALIITYRKRSKTRWVRQPKTYSPSFSRSMRMTVPRQSRSLNTSGCTTWTTKIMPRCQATMTAWTKFSLVNAYNCRREQSRSDLTAWELQKTKRARQQTQ